jgi:hypothetical protein
MRIHYLIIFLIMGIFVGEGQAMSPRGGGAPKRVGGGGVASRGAPLVSPGLPCDDIKDEKNAIECFSNEIIKNIPSWVVNKKITESEANWLEKNLKPLLIQAHIENKLKDGKYLYQLLKTKSFKEGAFTEKSVISPRLGTIAIVWIVSKIKDFSTAIPWEVGDLNPGEKEFVEGAQFYAEKTLSFRIKIEKHDRILNEFAGATGRERPERPDRPTGGAGPGAGSGGSGNPDRGPGPSLTKTVIQIIYSGW